MANCRSPKPPGDHCGRSMADPQGHGKASGMPSVGKLPRSGYCGGAGRAKCQMGWSTLRPRVCCRTLHAAGQRLISTATSIKRKARICWTGPAAALA
jgi:hypothetical protein